MRLLRCLVVFLSLTISATVITRADEVRITSNPTGADVTIQGTVKDGRFLKGQSDQHAKKMPTTFVTPVVTKVDGQRDPYRLEISKPGYFSEMVDVTIYGRKLTIDGRTVSAIHGDLQPQVIEREFNLSARTKTGAPITDAVFRVNGEAIDGSTARITFERPDRNSPFPTFTLASSVPDLFKESAREVAVGDDSTVGFFLSPVTEFEVARYFPAIRLTPAGPEVTIDESTTIGTVDDRDVYSPASALTKITNFQRGQIPLEAINSFAITPDGQQLIYSVTSRSQRTGEYFANLYHRPTEPSGSVTPLTSGDLYLDCYPAMCREPDSQMLVFQSNRISTEEYDISSLFLDKPRRITALTTQSGRFNIQPTFVAERKPIFFTSIQKLRSPQIAFVTTGSIAPTTLENVDGGMLNYAEDGRIYFAAVNEATEKFQISSITDDGSERTSYLTEDRFLNSNCHSPDIATDLRRLLFVCDYSSDPDARSDSNLWLVDLDGNQPPQQLTFNASDDIHPRWSPTEPNVIFFLSNRGGVYNIWRMEL